MKTGAYFLFFLTFGSLAHAEQIDCNDHAQVEKFCDSKCESKSDEEGDGGGTLGHRSPKQYCYLHCPSLFDCKPGTR